MKLNSLADWREMIDYPKSVRYIIGGAIALCCLLSLLVLLGNASSLLELDEAGYGDSYILYDVLHFQQTGVIYREPSQPPYLPSLYSPLVYILYSLPGRIASWANPFVGPRFVVLAFLLLCARMVVSIVRALIPARSAWLWGAALFCSISVLADWVLQLRGDFPGIFCSLLAIRLLMSRARWRAPLAGIFAGLALQFKLTFVAALIAGTLWLLVRRQWKDASVFAALGIVFSAGPYLLFSLREPRMLPQITSFSHPIVDIPGCVKLLRRAISEPVFLLALAGLPPVASGRWPRWSLLLLFAVTSFATGFAYCLQVGANVNYFFEGLFALVPLAALGVLRLSAFRWRRVSAGLFVAALFCAHFLPPRAKELFENFGVRFSAGPGSLAARNDAFRNMERVLGGRGIISTVPRLAMLDPAPPLMEPYLLAYLHRMGKFDPQPILERIHKSEFDVAITPVHDEPWRGIFPSTSGVRSAIEAAYRPQCVLLGYQMYLPRNTRPDSNALAAELARIGCVP